MSQSENKAKAEAVTKTPSYLEWLRVEELGYEMQNGTTTDTTQGQQDHDDDNLCFYCATPHTKLSKCVKCHVAAYCQKDCQVQDWKKQHKAACATFQRVGPDMQGLARSPEAAAAARLDVFHRIRFYACAYAAFKEATLGRGFLFIQADQSLAALSLAIPKDVHGRPLPLRGVMVHYLTMGEYDAELCRDDFELAVVRTDLQAAVDDYDEQKEVVLLMRFRCGHVAVGKAQLSMPFGSFRKLGTDFFAEQNAACLQLNIDDV